MPPKKYMNMQARRRVRAWLLWHMDRYKKSQADLERETGVDNSAISRALSLRSLGFDVFAALMMKTKPPFDADRVLNFDPEPIGVRPQRMGLKPEPAPWPTGPGS